MNRAGVRGWSWKNTTRCSRKARRIDATVFVCEVLREIHPEDLGAKRAGNAPDLHVYCSILMFWLLMMEP